MAVGGAAVLGLGALIVVGILAFGDKKAKASPGGRGGARGYPWNVYSEDTKQLQKEINAVLRQNGLATISEDGKLGGETCGAAQYVSDQYQIGVVPPTCRDFTWMPTTASGKTYDEWNVEIEAAKNNGMTSMTPQGYLNAAVKLESMNPPFPDLKEKALFYASRFREAAQAAGAKRTPG